MNAWTCTFSPLVKQAMIIKASHNASNYKRKRNKKKKKKFYDVDDLTIYFICCSYQAGIALTRKKKKERATNRLEEKACHPNVTNYSHFAIINCSNKSELRKVQWHQIGSKPTAKQFYTSTGHVCICFRSNFNVIYRYIFGITIWVNWIQSSFWRWNNEATRWNFLETIWIRPIIIIYRTWFSSLFFVVIGNIYKSEKYSKLNDAFGEFSLVFFWAKHKTKVINKRKRVEGERGFHKAHFWKKR